MPKAKLSKNCYWRGNVIWAKKRIKGKVYRFSLETDQPAIARARVRGKIETLTAEAGGDTTRKSWADAYNAWGDWYARERPFSTGTFDRYVTSIDQVSPFLDGLALSEANTWAKMNEIVEARQAAGVSIATIRRDLTAISSVLRHANEEKWIDGNAALAKLQNKRFRERRDPIILPERKHIDMVIRRAPGLFSRLIEAAVETGCRQNELVTAVRPNFDRDRKQLTVIGKGNKLRTIDLSSRGFAVFAGLPAHLHSKWLFWHDDGRPYKNVSSRFRSFVLGVEKEARKEGTEFRPFCFHDLRHYYAVQYLKDGGNIYLLQGQLGHESIKTTELYLKFLSPTEVLRAKFGAQNAAQERRSDEAGIAEGA